MKKFLFVLSLVLISSFGFANNGDNVSDDIQPVTNSFTYPEHIEGWCGTNSGYDTNFYGTLIDIPTGQLNADILLQYPTFTSWDVTVSSELELVSSSCRSGYIKVRGKNGGYISGGVTIVGVWDETGETITVHFSFRTIY